MKIELISANQVRVSDENAPRPVIFDISSYSRSRDRAFGSSEDDVETSADMFKEINEFFKTLPSERQYRIFQIYSEMREELSSIFSMRTMQRSLMELTRKLYELIPIEEINTWVRRDSNIRVPQNIKLDYTPDDPTDTIYYDRTYLKKDYQELATLAVALRPMVPIWGEFVKSSREFSGNTQKEMEAERLLYQTTLITSRPVERLRRYITAFALAHRDLGPSQATLMGGMSSTELPEWVLAITIVRRLPVCQIENAEDNSNIITNLHQFILHNLKGAKNKFGGKFNGNITDKEKSASQKEESNDSYMEMYKIKQAISDGDAVKISVYARNPLALAEKIDPTIPSRYIEECLEAIKIIANIQDGPHQRLLVQWVMHRPIPAEGVPLMDRQSLLVAMSVTQAALWHWGFYSLAVMVTAVPIYMEGGMAALGSSIPGRLSKTQAETLSRLFPHYQAPRIQNTALKTYNVAARAIENYCGLVGGREWELNAPPELMRLATQIENYRRYEPSTEIRTALFDLFLKITQ